MLSPSQHTKLRLDMQIQASQAKFPRSLPWQWIKRCPSLNTPPAAARSERTPEAASEKGQSQLPPACDNKEVNYSNGATITRPRQSTRLQPGSSRAVLREPTASRHCSRVTSETGFTKSSLLFALPLLSLAFLELSMPPDGSWWSSGYFNASEGL